MRKTSSTVAAAFKAGVSKSLCNTSTDGKTFFLHGNPIARKVGKRLEVSWAGWVTATTAERVNAVLSAYGSAFRVGRAKGQASAFANGVRSDMPRDGWQAVTDVSA